MAKALSLHNFGGACKDRVRENPDCANQRLNTACCACYGSRQTGTPPATPSKSPLFTELGTLVRVFTPVAP
jgi:hypothetical protein